MAAQSNANALTGARSPPWLVAPTDAASQPLSLQRHLQLRISHLHVILHGLEARSLRPLNVNSEGAGATLEAGMFLKVAATDDASQPLSCIVACS